MELAADKQAQAAQQQDSTMCAFMSLMQEQQQSLQAMLITQQQQQNKILMAGGYIREKGEAHLVQEPIFALSPTNVLWSNHIARSINCQHFHQ